MRGILGEQRLAQSRAHDRLLSGILASLAAQNANRILPFSAGTAKPSLNRRITKPNQPAADRVTPLARRQPGDLGAQPATWRR
jgi:hypothetical protein